MKIRGAGKAAIRADTKIKKERDFPVLKFPPVAQLDNAADSDSEERGFESLRAGYEKSFVFLKNSIDITKRL